MKLGTGQTGPNLGPGRRPLIDGLFEVPQNNIEIIEIEDTVGGEKTEVRTEISRGEIYEEGGRKLQLVTYSDNTTEIIDLGAVVNNNNNNNNNENTETESEFISDQVTIYKDGATSTAQRNVRPGEQQSELQLKLEEGWSLTPDFGDEEGGEGEAFNAREYAKANFSFLGEGLIDVFLNEYDTNGGDVDESLRAMRSTQSYKDKFPGIFREDGTTLRFTTETPELDYIKMQEDYFNALEDYNLNPQFFADKITDLFANDVDPKTFTGRLKTAYDSLFNQFDAVKAYYVENYPGQFPSVDNITDEAIFASFISEDISKDIIAQRINVSEIGGAFRDEDFTISTQQAQRLISAGLSGTGAQQIAQRAESQLPRLQKLAKRFTGREDIFGLSEFIESEVFGGGVADQLKERLEAEQRTVFTQEGGAAATQAGITGLVEQ
jgi:hypothetical protein